MVAPTFLPSAPASPNWPGLRVWVEGWAGIRTGVLAINQVLLDGGVELTVQFVHGVAGGCAFGRDIRADGSGDELIRRGLLHLDGEGRGTALEIGAFVHLANPRSEGW